jgi:hypothetical protein
MGAVTFSRYSQAADLANGVAWYAVLRIGTAAMTLVAVIAGLLDRSRAHPGCRKCSWSTSGGCR